jgi:hypothetical protein
MHARLDSDGPLMTYSTPAWIHWMSYLLHELPGGGQRDYLL